MLIKKIEPALNNAMLPKTMGIEFCKPTKQRSKSKKQVKKKQKWRNQAAFLLK